jgi:signal transduction histidine kinase/AraC-like DNA-binding protein
MWAAEELLDYVIPTIAMEIDDALSFKLVNNYRNSLQHKVDERTQELKEMNESLKKGQAGRDRLFSNISHEFRTPLTLILGPLEKILEESRGAKMRGRLGLIKKNAERLLRLINQLLELSKLQSGDVTLLASQFDLVQFLRGVVMSYRSLADTRHIRLTFRADCRSLALYLDREKAETLFNNLLVNAFKFTPDGGRIDVALHELESVAEVVIRDSGVGIAESELLHVFDRFYQGSSLGVQNIGGTGIGLALTKELTELHHGTIRVSSTAGIGTEFVVSLPLGRAHLSDKECVEQTVLSLAKQSHSAGERSAETKSQTDVHRMRGRRIVLVIDDDPDVRRYINDTISGDMEVIEAGDGEEGIRCAQKMIPDLIISDIMMPKRDGNELCQVLKEDLRTSHIPIILLTARAGTENRIEGLEKGADDYVLKPFVARELLARVKNLIALREKLRKRFSSERLLKSAELLVPSMDQGFLQKAMEIVDRHMSDEGFGIDDFSREIGLSRTQLHRKLVALTDCSARDFVRRLRLERASDLLHRNAGSISEIAYQVGFRDPSHFAKCFRKQFGVPPGALRPPARMSPMKG